MAAYLPPLTREKKESIIDYSVKKKRKEVTITDEKK